MRPICLPYPALSPCSREGNQYREKQLAARRGRYFNWIVILLEVPNRPSRGTIGIAFRRPTGPPFGWVFYPMYSYWVWPREGRTQCGMESRMGRIDEMWMTCRASLTAAVLDVRRMGMRCGRAPQIAILPMRLSLTHITIFRPSFASSFFPFFSLSPLRTFSSSSTHTGPQQTHADRRALILLSPLRQRGGPSLEGPAPLFISTGAPFRTAPGLYLLPTTSA